MSGRAVAIGVQNCTPDDNPFRCPKVRYWMNSGKHLLVVSSSPFDPNAKCRHFRYVIAIAGRDLGELLRLALPFSEIRGLQDNRGCRLGLILIELSSVAAAIITRMPARLSAICIASPSEMSTSAMWLASASRTPRQ
jgi:hypothetical protein